MGLVLCLAIWLAVPYNNFALNNSFVSDGYLPEIVLLCIACLVLVINPLLRRWWPAGAFSHRDLALITGMMMFAAVIPSNGLMRFMPHCLALDTQAINASAELSTAIGDSELPAALFPDSIGLGLPTLVSDGLVDELYPGESIPWSSWLVPLLAWGVLITGFWLMMIGLGAIVYPQWSQSERLAFPLLRVYHAMIDEPNAERLIPPVFRSRLFWTGCLIVLALHSLNGLSIFTGGACPGFPVSWDISNCFTEGLWRSAPGFLKRSRIYFLFVGLAYFMPKRYSFSIWFTVLVAGLFMMAAAEYLPLFHYELLYDQGCGALIAIAGGVMWLGRRHYCGVLAAALRPRRPDENRGQAFAGRLFLGGCVVMLGWFIWAGAGIGWSLFFVIMGVLIMFLVARIVAETGITYVWIIPLAASRITALLPQRWLTVSSAFLQEAHYIFANRASAVSAAVMMMLSLGLDRHAKPGTERRLAGTGITILLLGLLVCGAVHLHMGYNLATSCDGVIAPITGRGARLMSLTPVKDLVAGRTPDGGWESTTFIVWGICLAGGLLFLCSRFPGWPLHPIGLIFVYSSIGLRLCISLFIGWLLKKLILHYGGAQAYKVATPLFLGIIFGEVFASVLWTLVRVLMIGAGIAPGDIPQMIIFQYT